ncbi:hypothetical protein C4D60_Mb11t07940 [Musa balbisiana]|uniref:Amino acid transporter transmembrane domain-containing protein n=1 Tax=Musa balbisiana TaxID=52838 RepID=A0A4S8J2H9_MUSBA|nr:hypothetical protein C4D60_Mb11t07940 [Musa balbisiana]
MSLTGLGQLERLCYLFSSHGLLMPAADSWQQVGLMLVTGFNCAYVLSFSNLMLVPLGWAWGLTCLAVIGAFAYYANWLLSGLHVIDGHRFIRYRDLMGFVFGRRMYYLTWFLQFMTLLLGNMGFILLGGRALKEINSEFSNSPLRLQVFILATGVVYFIFAYFVPTMSAMRNWLATSAVLTVTYDVVLVAILVKDGKANKTKDYNIHGSEVEKVFNAFGAIAAILVCNTSGLLPEIQSTLRKPVVANMRKALMMQYTVGLAVYYGISIAGYWAYGSSVSEYLPYQLSGPRWGNVLINSTAFLQSVVSQHMFCAPIHEALDTKFQKLDEGMFSKANLRRRFALRALVFGLNAFVTALFPFMGDFVNLFGSFTLFPLTFVFPSMVFIKVRQLLLPPPLFLLSLSQEILEVEAILVNRGTLGSARDLLQPAAQMATLGGLQPLFSFGVISDVQYADIPDGHSFSGVPRYYRHSMQVLQRAISNWNDHKKLQFLMNFGDIVDGFCPKDKSLITVQKVVKEFDRFNGPTYHMIGNHCLYNLPRSKLISLLKMPSIHDHAYYDFSPCPGYRFIVLDAYEISTIGWPLGHPNALAAMQILEAKNPNSDKNSPNGMVGLEKRFLMFNGAVGKEQLLWLDDVLKDSTKNEQKVVICCHLPLHPEAASAKALLWDYEEVLNLIHSCKCVKACFAGHDHKGGYTVDSHGIHHRVFEAALECPPESNAYGVLPRKSNESMRIIISTVIGIVLGYLIGISFPTVSITKIYVPTNPRGAERLPPCIVVPESDFYLRRLWGNPDEDLIVQQKYLVTFTVGYEQKNNIDAAVKKFSENFTILLFHYDGRTTEWDEFEWSKRAIHVSARKQTKWWYAKRFLHPDIVARYEYIFIWDEDLGLEHFDAEEYIKLVKKHGLEISQPGLEPNNGLTWQMTKRRGDHEVHKETEERPGWCADPHLPPCAAFVEIMATVFSRDAWRCVWHMIQNDLVHGWGLDFALRKCVEPAHEKIGVVDAQWIVHQVVPSLGNQGQAEKGRAPWEGVRQRCRKEWAIFQSRLSDAEKAYYLSLGIAPPNSTVT